MIRKRIDIGVGKQFVMLVHSFLTNRSQYVNVSGVCARHICLSPPELLRDVYCRLLHALLCDLNIVFFMQPPKCNIYFHSMIAQ